MTGRSLAGDIRHRLVKRRNRPRSGTRQCVFVMTGLVAAMLVSAAPDRSSADDARSSPPYMLSLGVPSDG